MTMLEELLHLPITKNRLVGLKTTALRKRTWFRVSDRVERSPVDHTIRWVNRVKSGMMARVLMGIRYVHTAHAYSAFVTELGERAE